jgi:hypothetical protein
MLQKWIYMVSKPKMMWWYLTLASSSLIAQPYNVSVTKQSNYNSWGTGWDSVYVLQNNLVTCTIVPAIGGRTMQYDLGAHSFMFFNNAMKGTTSTAGGQMWGGMRQLASPQSDFTGNWPPPPTLDSRAYTATITQNSIDSSSVYLESQIEASDGTNFNGLRFKRTITLYKNSSRVQVKMTMVNANNAVQRNHGIWDITEVTGGTSGITYDTMIWVYVPLDPSSAMGAGRGYAQLQQRDTTQWIKNAAPGVLGIQYRHVEAKMGADSKAGWICNIDRRNGYAYVKRFTYVNAGSYPDSGSSVEVYTYGSSYSCLEVEVMGPMVTLATGDSTTLYEDWFATRSFGPVYSVNNAGLITRPLSARKSGDSVSVLGVYGVFYPGYVKSVFIDASGTTLSIADSVGMTPLDSLTLNKSYQVPANVAKLVLMAYKIDGTSLGCLDSVILLQTTVISGSSYVKGDPRVTVRCAGPLVRIVVNSNQAYTVEICRLDGKRIASFSGSTPQTFSCHTERNSSSIYLVKSRLADYTSVQKVFFPGGAPPTGVGGP